MIFTSALLSECFLGFGIANAPQKKAGISHVKIHWIGMQLKYWP